jgi:hypothetical protein
MYTGFVWLRIGTSEGYCEQGNETSGSISQKNMLHGLCTENLLSLAECAISPCSFCSAVKALRIDIKSHDYNKHNCILTDILHAFCNSNDITDIHFAIA